MVNVPSSLLKRLENLAFAGGKKKKGKGRRRKGGSRTRRPRTMSGHSSQDQHAVVMQRPFVSPLPAGTPGFYDGEQGTVGRFFSDFAPATSAGQTAYFQMFHPNTGFIAIGGAATSATAITPVTFSVGANTPGNTFLSGSAQKVRSLAAAMRFAIPSLSVTTIVGEFAVGVASYDTVAAATTVDQLFTLAAARGQVSKDLHEVRWYPGSFDSKYATYTTVSVAATGSDLNDTNIVFLAVRGVPASTTFSCQITNIVEWTPKFGSGMAPTMQTSSGTDHQGTVAALHKADPGWHHTVKHTGERLLERAVSGAGVFVEKAAEKWAPKLFAGGMAAFGL